MESADLINAVLDLDEKITARLDAAVKDKENVIAMARAEADEMIKKEVGEASARIEMIGADERRKAEERIAATENKKAEKLAELDRIFSEKHGEWENSLFEAVKASTEKL